MSGVVNEYFKQYYPANLDKSKMNFSSMLGGMWEYEDYSVSKIFPRITCKDGFNLSVQAHCGAYSHPRDDFASHYTTVEIGYPSERVEEFMPYIDGDEDTNPTETVYGYVPVEVVEKIIAAHGGIKEGGSP